MSENLRIALAQMNFMVGDVAFNAENVMTWLRQSEELNVDIMVFPELTLCGYPPEDLLLRPELHQQINQMIAKIATVAPQLMVILGAPQQIHDQLYNAAFVLHQGQIHTIYHKQCLPNYNVFDEKRYFDVGHQPCVIPYRGVNLGILICEDLWSKEPLAATKAAGADLILSPNASPFSLEKDQQRQHILQQRIQENHLPILYSHWVGGQDEFIFDGGSMVLDQHGKLIAHAGFFQEKLLLIDCQLKPALTLSSSMLAKPIDDHEKIYQALVMGVRDYCRKNKARGALVGLSGGIDSALTICIAVDALGAENVEAVLMPSRYTSTMSVEDAVLIANNLKIEHSIIDIEPLFQSFLTALAPRFEELPPDLTEQNLQSRIRGTLLMAISNKTGKLVLTTSNKSETAVGYATLYGDTAGALAVLKDVYKTTVYELVNWRNQQQYVIPERVITRPPSAELAPDQTDEQSLPPYPILDAIIADYVEQDLSQTDIIAKGIEAEVVKKVCGLIDRNEYKRRQSPPGIRISSRAFGRDRRYPITSGFKGIIA
ncbi:MAG: NAD+ synthase [Legionellales bacterium]|nr:NAD+ synthase [Legionellales bacterium]